MVKWDKELYHYGIPRRSGRYPWGSGKDPYHHGKGMLGRVADMVADRARKSFDSPPTLNDRHSFLDGILNKGYNDTSSKLKKISEILIDDLDIKNTRMSTIEPTAFTTFTTRRLTEKKPWSVAEKKIFDERFENWMSGKTKGRITGDWDKPESLRFEAFSLPSYNEISEIVDGWASDNRRRLQRSTNSAGVNVYRKMNGIRRLR